MARADAPKDTVREVKFKGDQKEKLKEYLRKEIENCENDRSELMQKCKAWVEQANSRRKRSDSSSPRDAQLDMPLTRQRMMQNASRLINPVLQQDVLFVAKPRNPAADDLARKIEDVTDYISDQIDYRSLMDEWIEQFQTFPAGIVKTPFVFETERVMRWQELPGVEEYNMRKLDGQKVTIRKLEDGTEKYFLEVDEEVPVKVGAFPEVVPFEDFYIPRSACDVRTADWVAHRVWMTKAQIKHQILKGIYRKRDGDQDVLEALGAPENQRERLLKLEEGKWETVESDPKQYEIFECYLKWDVYDDGDPVEIIVTFDRDNCVFLRCIHNFYHSYKRPFVSHQYRKVHGSVYGIPLTYILEPLHVAYSACFNQRLDAASKANETLYVVPPGTDLKPLMRSEFRTNFVEGMLGKDEITEIKLSNPFPGLEGIEQRLEREADKLSSLSDYSFGNEQIDRPTASGQIQIIEESKQPQYSMLEQFRKSLADVCKHVLARYKQFYPEGLQYYQMQETPDGMQLIEQFFQWPDGVIERDVIIETKVSSSSMSKNLRKQELVALVDKMTQIYQTMMQMSTMAADPNNPGALMAAKLLNGLWTAVNEMLTEFEVGKKDALNPKLVEVAQVVQQIQGQMQQLVQQNNQLAGQNQQLQGALSQIQGMGVPGQGMAGTPQPPPGLPGLMPMAGQPQGPGVPQAPQG